MEIHVHQTIAALRLRAEAFNDLAAKLESAFHEEPSLPVELRREPGEEDISRKGAETPRGEEKGKKLGRPRKVPAADGAAPAHRGRSRDPNSLYAKVRAVVARVAEPFTAYDVRSRLTGEKGAGDIVAKFLYAEVQAKRLNVSRQEGSAKWYVRAEPDKTHAQKNYEAIRKEIVVPTAGE